MTRLTRMRTAAHNWADRHLTRENGRRITQGLVDSYSRAAGPRWANRCFKGLREQGYEVPAPEPRRWGGRLKTFALGLGVGVLVGATLGTTASELGTLGQLRNGNVGKERAPVLEADAVEPPSDELVLAEVRRLIAKAGKETENDGEREQEREEAPPAEEEGRAGEAGR